MSKVKCFLVGRDGRCDFPIDDGSVSRRHAEVVPLADGRVYVTDCASTHGTFALQGGTWKSIRQDYLDGAGRVRFGNCEVPVARLHALRGRGGEQQVKRSDRIDPDVGVRRNPVSGEVMEKEGAVDRARARRSHGS